MGGFVSEVISAPSASVLIESMRDIGYSLESAIADLIDNSISAGARRIHVEAEYRDTGPYIAVVDDGRGMSADELLRALRLGSQSPLADRDHDDLGRFGLGLKTASFSQCRKLTVISRRGGQLSGACWDLDRVAETDEWTLQILEDPLGFPGVELSEDDGTAIVWERIDRIVGTLAGLSAEETFTYRLAAVVEHLSLVFHRFLKSGDGFSAITIDVNGRALEPVDPFLSSHPQTRRIPSSPEAFPYDGKRVFIQGFTLPHHSKVSKTDWKRHEGPHGYLKSQGFYVYRERRLIIWGTWFGLIRASEQTKLARVRIDITNDQDADWKIDVRKASAQPPPQVRTRLREIIEQLTADSRTRGSRTSRRLASEVRIPMWERTLKDDQFRYTVNPDHPLIGQLVEQLEGESLDVWKSVAVFLSASLPLDRILGDMSSSPKDSAQLLISSDELQNLARVMTSALKAQGMTESDVKASLQGTEPFSSNWNETRKVIEWHFGGKHE